MSTLDQPQSQTDAGSREVARLVAEGTRVTDPELRRRIQERAERVRNQSRLTDVAAELTDPNE